MDILIVFFILLPLLFFVFTKLPKILSANLPPGPRPWPVVGNILHLGPNPHVSLTRLARIHGPLISLKLGSQLLIAASSPAAAAQVLRTHDRLLSARRLPSLALPRLQQHSLVWAADCGETWKTLRALCRTGLFSAAAMASGRPMREKKTAEMADFIGCNEGRVLNLGEIVFAAVFNTMGQLCFSRDLIDVGGEDGGGLKRIIGEMMELGAMPNISDFYPVLERWDLQGLKKKFMGLVQELFAVWEMITSERRAKKKGVGPCDDGIPQDFLDVMIASGFSDIQIHVLALELFSAGTETTTSTVEWAMSELIKNKDAMNKVRAELQRELGVSNTIDESQIPKLTYLHACVKETLRLHPPVPFLIPHNALEMCQIMGYTIPKNSKVIVNLWAIGRDPMIWKDSLLFNPERFIDSNLDFKGQDFEFLPFGAGRRMCPGLPLATQQVHFILATLLHSFDWFLPHEDDPCKLDMSEKFGITLKKKQPLLLISKKRQ